MRFALVVFFFLGLFFALRNTPPPDIGSQTARNAPNQPERRAPSPPPVAVSQAPSQPPAAAFPPSSATESDDAAEDLDVAEAVVETGETERGGEERTSVRKAQQLPMTTEEIETGLQKELTRMACFSGRSERNWGRRSRSALRRFTSRAKPKEGNAPTEALLKVMRNYPVSYCKTCRPGQAECKIEPPAAPKRSDLGIPRENTSSFSSYLPPWMTGEDFARAAAEENVRQPFPDIEKAGRPEGLEPRPHRERARARRRGAKRDRLVGERSNRDRQPKRRRLSSWPTISDWPGGR